MLAKLAWRGVTERVQARIGRTWRGNAGEAWRGQASCGRVWRSLERHG